MQVDPTLTSQKTTHAASTHSAARATAGTASLFSTALAKASTKATTKATASSDTSSAQNVSTSTKVPKGEKSEHVKGHSYDEVTAGPRDGMFINRSGNKRDGQAFARVLRDGREFHVYGTGKHRLIVEVKKKDTDTDGTSTTPDTSSQSGSSGSSGTTGTTAPATDTTGAPLS
jgi:hypothetical protein